MKQIDNNLKNSKKDRIVDKRINAKILYMLIDIKEKISLLNIDKPIPYNRVLKYNFKINFWSTRPGQIGACTSAVYKSKSF